MLWRCLGNGRSRSAWRQADSVTKSALPPGAQGLHRPLRVALASLTLLALRAACRIMVDGADNVPRQGPVVLVGNHVNPIEAPLIAGFLPRSDMKVVVSDHLRQRAVLRRALDLMYDILWINRMNGRVDLLAQASPMLAEGHVVALMPEGRYSWNGRLGAGEDGAALLALSTGAVVVPVVTIGLEDVPRSLKRLRRSAVTIRFGAPFYAPRRSMPTPTEISSTTGEIMRALARLLPASKRGRWNIDQHNEPT
jgi:1-acyl-sn-glycerol-3-phosphate acyltransferase